MSRRLTFNDICNILAARRCWNAGQSLTEIARSAKRSKSTIRNWIRKSGINVATERRHKDPTHLA
ncbi:MAG: hypothetical protein P4L84_32795 [Isosphaeraceae bacterium]|nr:hypothetical protein [Isosphaeraceae bacterium]